MNCKWLVAIVLSSCFSTLGFAQVRVIDEPMVVPPRPVWSIKELTIHAAKEPKPALRYLFWSNSLRTIPDNAIVHILRAIVAYDEASESAKQYQLDHYATRYETLQGPSMEDFPIQQTRDNLLAFEDVLDELHQANLSQRIEYDFRVYDNPRQSLFTSSLRELDIMYKFSRILIHEIRLAIAEKRFDDAITSLQTGFRLGEITSVIGGQTYIGKLTGVNIHSNMLEEVKILMQQPGAPNLYWALASVPDEFGDTRRALEGESEAFANEFSSIMRLPTEPVTSDGWHQRIGEAIFDALSAQAERVGSNSNAPESKLMAGLAVLTMGESSKAYLVSQGKDAAAVEKMSYAEATVRATQQEVSQIRDDFFKWTLLPASDSKYSEPSDLHSLPMTPGKTLASLFFPGISYGRHQATKMLTTRNQLITIEAIAAYASLHQNELPQKLENLEPLPAWNQIIGGKPFEYQRASNTQAKLLYAPHDWFEPEPYMSVTLAK